MKDDDRDLFRNLMGDVKRHKPAERANLKQSVDFRKKLSARKRAVQFSVEQSENPLTSIDYIDRVDPHQTISFMRSGLQHSVFKNLRQGKISLEADLDLHGYTVEQAREQLVLFLNACQSEGLRTVLITHGHGEFREAPALLKSCVNHWLGELDMVMAFHSAQPKHGGSGATYVLLRKPRQDRENDQ